MAFSGNDGRSQVPTEKKRKIRETRNIFLKIRKINYFTIEKKKLISQRYFKKKFVKPKPILKIFIQELLGVSFISEFDCRHIWLLTVQYDV